MASELAERLRRAHADSRGLDDATAFHLCHEAADAIEQLTREWDEARRLLGQWKDHTVNCQVHQLNHKENRYVCKCGLDDARAFLAASALPTTEKPHGCL